MSLRGSRRCLSRRRPDIPLLLVEGAGKAGFLPEIGDRPEQREEPTDHAQLARRPGLPRGDQVALDAVAGGTSRSVLWRPRPCSMAFPCWPAIAGRCRKRSATPGFCSTSLPSTRRRPANCPRPRRSSPGSRRSSAFGTTRPSMERRSQAARERAQQWHPDRLGTRLPRVLRQLVASARPAAGAAMVNLTSDDVYLSWGFIVSARA